MPGAKALVQPKTVRPRRAPVTGPSDASRRPDEALLLAFRDDGDRDALAELFGRYQGRVHGLVRTVLGPARAAAADDVTSETFLRVIHGAARWQPRGSVRAWLFRIAVNEARQATRAAGRRARHEEEAAVRTTRREADGGRLLAPEEAAFRGEVLAAVEALPATLREPVLLRYLGGLSYAEVAAALEVPAGTVASRIHAAVEQLRGRLVPAGASALAAPAFEPALAGALDAIASEPVSATLAARIVDMARSAPTPGAPAGSPPGSPAAASSGAAKSVGVITAIAAVVAALALAAGVDRVLEPRVPTSASPRGATLAATSGGAAGGDAIGSSPANGGTIGRDPVAPDREPPAGDPAGSPGRGAASSAESEGRPALEATGTILGLVVLPGGEPVEGASVQASVGGRILAARTDRGGRFVLDDVAAGRPFDLLVFRTRVGALPICESITLAPGETRSLRLVVKLGLIIRGRVVGPGGAPLGGTGVALAGGVKQVMVEPLHADHLAPPAFSASTGDDGRFELRTRRDPDDALTAVDLVAFHPALRERRVALADGELVGGALDLGTIELEGGGRLVGVVRTPQGRPISDATVLVGPEQPARIGGLDDPVTRVATTGADGRFAIAGLIEGPHRVLATALGCVPAELVEVPVEPAPAVSSAVELLLVEGHAIEGECRWDDGTAVAGATVRVRLPSVRRRVWRDPIFRFDGDDEERPLETIRGLAVATVKSGPDGHFRIEAAPTDGVVIAASLPADLGSATTEERVHRPGDALVFTFTRRGALDVRVAGPDGEPLAGTRAAIRARRVGGHGAVPEGSAEGPSDDGAWHLTELPAGRYEVTALAAGFRVGRAETDLAPGERRGVSIALERATGRLTGAVVALEDGSPIVDAEVSIYEWIRDLGDGNRAAAMTGADGRFVLEGLLGPDVADRVEVRAPGRCPVVIEGDLEGGAEPRIVLERAGRIAGRVLDDRGAPVALATVWRVRPGESLMKGTGRQTATDADGRFAFDEVPGGRWRVFGDGTGSEIVTLPAGGEREVELRPGE